MENLSAGTMVDHDRYGEGVIGKVNVTNYEIYFAHGGKVSISKNSEEVNVVSKPENAPPTINLDVNQIKDIFDAMLGVVIDKVFLLTTRV